MENRFTKSAKRALTLALEAAQGLGHTYVGSEHLLLGMLGEGEGVASRILGKHGIVYGDIFESIRSSCGGGSPTSLESSDLTPRMRRLLEASLRLCEKGGQSSIGTEHLLYSLLSEEDCLALRLLEQRGIYIQELQGEIMSFMRSASQGTRSGARSERGDGGRSKARSGGIFWRDLVRLARDGAIDPTLCRDAETERVMRILCRRKKNNPCLIGEPGVGKTAIAEGLALRIAEGTVPSSLTGKLIYALDLPSMIAGAKYRGEFEERMKELISECAADPRIILFIDELHTLIGAGGAEGAIDAANILKPALARGEIRVIGATTVTEYRRYIERDPALERRFQPVSVCEPSIDDARRMLFGLRSAYEKHHGVAISDEAIEASLELSTRYIHDRFLPDKAIDLIDEAAARLSLRSARGASGDGELLLLGKLKNASVGVGEADGGVLFGSAVGGTVASRQSVGYGDVAAVVTELTGIPTGRLLGDEGERLMGLEDALGEKIIGQGAAIGALCEAIRRGRLGFGQVGRPVGSFLFAGPSGVGKSALCVALAEVLFGSGESLLRFDMSEYMEKHSVSKLIGSPPGYVGYGEGGLLTEGVHRNPYCVILFDEVEKAHPEVFDLLLQILEDGVLTDSQGRRVSFGSTVIIMTSNLGTNESGGASLGFCGSGDALQRAKEREREVRRAVEGAFRAELLARIDEIIIFNSLSPSELDRICALMLDSLAERLSGRGICAEFTPSLRRLVLDGADTDRLGARGIRRSIRQAVENPLSRLILSSHLGRGRIIVDAEGGEVKFSILEGDEKGGESV